MAERMLTLADVMPDPMKKVTGLMQMAEMQDRLQNSRVNRYIVEQQMKGLQRAEDFRQRVQGIPTMGSAEQPTLASGMVGDIPAPQEMPQVARSPLAINQDIGKAALETGQTDIYLKIQEQAQAHQEKQADALFKVATTYKNKNFTRAVIKALRSQIPGLKDLPDDAFKLDENGGIEIKSYTASDGTKYDVVYENGERIKTERAPIDAPTDLKLQATANDPNVSLEKRTQAVATLKADEERQTRIKKASNPDSEKSLATEAITILSKDDIFQIADPAKKAKMISEAMNYLAAAQGIKRQRKESPSKKTQTGKAANQDKIDQYKQSVSEALTAGKTPKEIKNVVRRHFNEGKISEQEALDLFKLADGQVEK